MQGANYEAIYLTKEALCSQFQAQLTGPGPGTPLCSSQDEPQGCPMGAALPQRDRLGRGAPQSSYGSTETRAESGIYSYCEVTQKMTKFGRCPDCAEKKKKFLNKKKPSHKIAQKAKWIQLEARFARVRTGEGKSKERARSKPNPRGRSRDHEAKGKKKGVARSTKGQRRVPGTARRQLRGCELWKRQRPRPRRPPPPSGRAPRGAARSHDSP